jgi:hypothetical protein
MLDTLPSNPLRNGLVYAEGLQLYFPSNQIQCAEYESICVNDMQRWMVGDDGRLQLTAFTSQCLALISPVIAVGMVMQSTVCVAADYMRWLPLLESESLESAHLLRTGASSFPLLCLSGAAQPPFVGKVTFLLECILSDQDDDGAFVDRRHMQWRLLETGEYKHELTGLCITASAGNGGPVFLSNCLVITDDAPVNGAAVDYSPHRRFGSFVGGTRYQSSLAPIDRSPEFTLFNGKPVTSSLQRVFAQVGRVISFVLEASDPNTSDEVSIELYGNIPSGASVSPITPSRRATRVFSWTPNAADLLYNPTDIYCRVTDVPTNPLNPNSVAEPSFSSELQVQMVVLLPPEWAPVTPAEGAVFEARVGASLQLTMVATDRNSGDAVQIEYGQNCHESRFPPLPMAHVSLSANIPAPGPPPFPNPVSRMLTFSPLPAHSNMSFCACFVAKSAGANSPIRCITVRVLEFAARFVEDGGVGAVLPHVLPPSAAGSLLLLGLGGTPEDSVQLLQGQSAAWCVGVSVAGASGFSLSSSRVVQLPAVGYHETPSVNVSELKTSNLDPSTAEAEATTGSNSSSSIVALRAEWHVPRGRPGIYLICFVFSVPVALGQLHQLEG